MPRVTDKCYPPGRYTWGFELEVGDVDRRLIIPERMGRWEHAERDVVNLLPPYQYIACDPLGIQPPVGGEINTRPTTTWQGQVQLLKELLDWLRAQGQYPTSNCISHSHVHVHVPGLTEDLEALKWLTRYIRENQSEAIRCCYAYHSTLLGGNTVGANYLKWDGGRPMPDWQAENIIQRADSFDDYIRLHCCGKDGVSRGRPWRYAINTYCLKHISTIEFRLFRHTLDLKLLSNCFRFVEQFMDAALNGGPTVMEILRKGDYQFPPFTYDVNVAKGWLATKWGDGRGKKERRYLPVATTG